MTELGKIENELGVELEWRTATKDSRILALHSGNIKHGEEVWTKCFDWYCDMAIRLRAIAKKYEK